MNNKLSIQHNQTILWQPFCDISLEEGGRNVGTVWSSNEMVTYSQNVVILC